MEHDSNNKATTCMDCGHPLSDPQRTCDTVDGAILCHWCADGRARRRMEAGERTLEGLMTQRKAAFVRWSFAKGYLSYRGEDVSLLAGPDQDKIGYHRLLYEGIAGLTAVLRRIDERSDDSPEFRQTLWQTWEDWLSSDEARQAHVKGL